MDGHFVPNLSMGPDVVKMARQCLKIPLSAAERLKVEYGSVLLEDTLKSQTISLTGEISTEFGEE